MGKGASLSCDWFLAQSPIIAGSPYVLIAPGGRQFVFDSAPDGQGNYRNSRDPELLGAALTFSGAPPGNLSATLRWKDGRRFFFDSGGALYRMEDRHANAVTITRNASGFATQISLWSTRFLALTYDGASGKLVQIDAKYGAVPNQTVNTWTLAYNSTTGRLSKITQPAISGADFGETLFAWTSYTRSWNGQNLSLPLISQITLANGKIALTHGYNSAGRLTSHRAGSGGGIWNVTYSTALGSNGYTQVTDPRNNVTRWDYTWHAGRYGYKVTSTVDALNRTTTFERNASPTHLITAVEDFRGRRVTQGWDATRGNLTSVTLPTASGGAVTWSATYEPNFSRQTSVTDPLNRTTSWNVNPSTGNVTSVTDPRGAVTSFTYATNGDRLSTTNALNQTTTFTYDSTTGDRLTATNPLNQTTTYSYTRRSEPFEVIDANNRKVRYEYNHLQWLASETRYLGLFGDTPLVTAYTYDKVGNRIGLDDPMGARWSWTLDPYDRVSEEWDPRLKKTTFWRDANSNVTRRTDKVGNWIDYAYGTGDRLTSLTCKKASGSTESTVTLTYDSTTKLLTSVADTAFGTTSFVYDSLDRITSVSGPHGTVSQTLDNLGRRTSMTVTGQATVTYAYGPTDLITSVTQNSQTVTIEWDLLSRIKKRTFPNTVSTEWSYNAAGRLTSLVSKRGTTTFDSHSYTHDSVGNILSHVRNGATDSYQYDEIYRLKQATVGGTLYQYWYDHSGNRTQNQVGGSLITYEYDAANRVTTINGVAVQNDDNGNLIGFGNESYTWDVRGRLTKLVKGGVTYEYQYDPQGLRTGKKVGGAWTYFLLDGDSVVKEITGTTSVHTTQGPLIDQPLARNGRTFTVNHQGSTTTLTDSAGQVVQSYQYGPFGETTQSTGEVNPFQYAGRENDGATGLYYNRARYYRPEWGRFISADPIGFEGGLNHYGRGTGLSNPADPTLRAYARRFLRMAAARRRSYPKSCLSYSGQV